MTFILNLLALLLFINSSFARDEDDLLVTIKQGTLSGTLRQNRKNGTFVAFRSIPYGQPPIGSLRFQPPKPHNGWTGIFNASEDLPVCYQAVIGNNVTSGQEDCLYLNVFTRKVRPHKLKSVLVFFHGGGYMQGDAREDYYNANFLLTEDIVLVTVAYRLGIFGFLNLGLNTRCPVTANAGLRDQALALRWIRNNIRKFGGNRNSVTIFGESAGAASVNLHMFSPLSKGLFHKIIADSGSILNEWAIGQPGSGEVISKELGLTSAGCNSLLQQLQSLPAADIIEAQNNAFGPLNIRSKSYFAPVIDAGLTQPFLPKDPVHLLEIGNYTHVPQLTGYNDKEGIVLDLFNRLYNEFLLIYNLTNLIPYSLHVNNNVSAIQQIVDEASQFYFDGNVPTINDTSVELINWITDIWFSHGMHTAVQKFARNGDLVYLYRFSVDTRLNYFKRLSPVTAQYEGASHVDELGYSFQTIFTPSDITVLEDQKISEMVLLWTNFAIYSDPTYCDSADGTVLGNFKWKPLDRFNTKNVNYLDFSNNPLSNKVNPDSIRIAFWENIFRKYGKN